MGGFHLKRDYKTLFYPNLLLRAESSQVYMSLTACSLCVTLFGCPVSQKMRRITATMTSAAANLNQLVVPVQLVT